MAIKRRSRLEIAYDILISLESGDLLPTHIRNKGKLAYSNRTNSLKRNLTFLVADGLVEEINYVGIKKYRITPKGREATEYYKKARSYVEELL